MTGNGWQPIGDSERHNVARYKAATWHKLLSNMRDLNRRQACVACWMSGQGLSVTTVAADLATLAVYVAPGCRGLEAVAYFAVVAARDTNYAWDVTAQLNASDIAGIFPTTGTSFRAHGQAPYVLDAPRIVGLRLVNEHGPHFQYLGPHHIISVPLSVGPLVVGTGSPCLAILRGQVQSQNVEPCWLVGARIMETF